MEHDWTDSTKACWGRLSVKFRCISTVLLLRQMCEFFRIQDPIIARFLCQRQPINCAHLNSNNLSFFLRLLKCFVSTCTSSSLMNLLQISGKVACLDCKHDNTMLIWCQFSLNEIYMRVLILVDITMCWREWQCNFYFLIWKKFWNDRVYKKKRSRPKYPYFYRKINYHSFVLGSI
jgi:hypothetical protein